MELKPAYRWYVAAALCNGFRAAGIAAVALATSAGIDLVRNRPHASVSLPDAFLVVLIVGGAAFVASFVLNLSRAPTFLVTTPEGIRLTIDGSSRTIRWSDICSVEFPRKSAWLIDLVDGRRAELWPYAYSPQDRRTLRATLAGHVGGAQSVESV